MARGHHRWCLYFLLYLLMQHMMSSPLLLVMLTLYCGFQHCQTSISRVSLTIMQFLQNCDHFLDAFINATSKMVPFLIHSFFSPCIYLLGEHIPSVISLKVWGGRGCGGGPRTNMQVWEPGTVWTRERQARNCFLEEIIPVRGPER